MEYNEERFSCHLQEEGDEAKDVPDDDEKAENGVTEEDVATEEDLAEGGEDETEDEAEDQPKDEL